MFRIGRTSFLSLLVILKALVILLNLLKIMEKSCKMNVQDRKDLIFEFVGDSKSFSDPTKTKEEVLPDPVPDYKFSFNLQD